MNNEVPPNDEGNSTKKFKVKLWQIILLSIVVYLFFSYITMRINHKPIYDWWNRPNLENKAYNTINGKAYSNVFNMDAMLAWQTSTPMFSLIQFFAPPSTKLTNNQYTFLYQEIMPFVVHVIDHKPYGIITPKSLCQTVLLTTADGDYEFNRWYDTPNARIRNGVEIDENIVLTQDLIKITSFTEDDYNYKYVSRECGTAGRLGLWAGVDMYTAWSAIFLDWLNYDKNGVGPSIFQPFQSNNVWVLRLEKDNIWYPFWYTKNSTPASFDNWYNRPDNFLGRMLIPCQSPLAIYFINDIRNVKSLQVDPVAFNNLIGYNTSLAGGWVGYVKGMGDKSPDDLRSFITSEVQDNPPDPPPPVCSKKPNVANGILSGVSAALGIGVMALFPEVSFLATIGIGVAALASGGIAAYQAAKPTC